MELKTDKIDVVGKIDNLLSKIHSSELNVLPSKLKKEKLLEGMVNRPIMNGDKIVGVITDYDIDTGFWYGFIWCDTYPSIMENYICSVELK